MGTGKPKREFLFVDDMADASIFLLNLDKNKLMENTNSMVSHINIGTGKDISIREIAKIIKTVIGYNGELKYNLSKPDGAPRKLLDVSLIHKLGWKHSYKIIDGIKTTFEWYKKNN